MMMALMQNAQSLILLRHQPHHQEQYQDYPALDCHLASPQYLEGKIKPKLYGIQSNHIPELLILLLAWTSMGIFLFCFLQTLGTAKRL